MSIEKLLQQFAGQENVVGLLQQLKSIQITDDETAKIQQLSEDDTAEQIISTVQGILSAHTSEEDNRVGNTVNLFWSILAVVVCIGITIYMGKLIINALDAGDHRPTAVMQDINYDENNQWRKMLDGE